MRVLLITLAVGYDYLQRYNKLFRKSHESYAERNGYDFEVVTHFLDRETEYTGIIDTLSLNKILVCSPDWYQIYDMIIFIDADILIHKNAPALHTFIDYGDKIGVINEFAQPSFERRIALQKRNGWETTGREYYALSGIEFNSSIVINTGVLVFQPKKHKEFLETIFNIYVAKCIQNPRGFIYEQTVIGYEIQKADKHILLPSEFNTIWALYKWENPEIQIEDFFQKTWFLHFAGSVDLDKVELLHKYC